MNQDICRIKAKREQLISIGCKGTLTGKHAYIVKLYPDTDEVEIQIDIDHIVVNKKIKYIRYVLPLMYITRNLE